MENHGFIMIKNLDIHPICVIDENAIIDFNLVWFIPIIDPIIALIIGMEAASFDGIKINIKMDIGASFCHVDKIIQDVQEIEVITDGNHMWHGAIPNLISIEITNINIIRGLLIIISHQSDDDVIRNIVDPTAWTKKYFSIASVSWNLLDDFSNGMNVNILISRAAHVNIRLFLDTAIKLLIITDAYKREYDNIHSITKII